MKGFRRLMQTVAAILLREPWWAEFWSASTVLAWASMSSFSGTPLEVWPSMRVLLHLTSDRGWHEIGFGLGVSQLVFLMFDRRWLRWGAAVALSWFWGVLTLGVWEAVPWAPAVAVYAGWCGINAFSILRLLRHFDAA